MSFGKMLLPEFDQEMASTRKVLERVPEDKLDWQPHARSHTIGWNANHLAELPAWVAEALTKTALDIAPPDGPRYQSPSFRTRQQILEIFDQNVATARQLLEAVTDEEVDIEWSLLKGGQKIFAMPRRSVIRSFVMNHSIHHRAVLCVYLRLNDIPVPGMYGPSGDE